MSAGMVRRQEWSGGRGSGRSPEGTLRLSLGDQGTPFVSPSLTFHSVPHAHILAFTHSGWHLDSSWEPRAHYVPGTLLSAGHSRPQAC